MSWSNRYIGIPWLDLGRTREGCDCWGLVHLVYEAEAGIKLPTYDQRTSSAERREIAAIVAGGAASPDWRLLAENDVYRDLDILTFRVGRFDCHVGLRCEPQAMLHASEGGGSRIERFNSGAWWPRLTGIWRHRGLDR